MNEYTVFPEDKDELDLILSLDGPIITQYQKNKNYSQYNTINKEVHTNENKPPKNFFTKTPKLQNLLAQNANQFASATSCSQNLSFITSWSAQQATATDIDLSVLSETEFCTAGVQISQSSAISINEQECPADIPVYTVMGNSCPIISRQDSKALIENPSTYYNTIPKSIFNLFKTVRTSFSDFSFVYALSAQMCQQFMPMECYVEFKMGLLLSLASIQADGKKSPLPIVGIGQDTSFANLLMSEIGNFANRLITPMDKFQATVLQNENKIDSSPLLLARGGVYYLGDWSRLNPTTASKILKEVNCGYVSIDKAPINYPIHSAIWCYWKNYKNNLNDLKTLGIFLKVFGIPFLLEETSAETLTDFLIEQATVGERLIPDDDLSIKFDDMKQFLAIVSKHNVGISSESADLLKKYFIASRVDRPECLTEKAYSSLIQMSESFAKLSLHDEVISPDAIAAIYLSEHFIKNVFGPGVFPPPLLSGSNDIEDVELIFNNFQQWLNIYLSRFSPNESNNII